MPTAKQIAANRANAERSTGPKTLAGKLKASRNAFQHGLSLPLRHDMAASTKADALALALAGEQASEEERMAAHEVAQAQLKLVRIRAVRAESAEGTVACVMGRRAAAVGPRPAPRSSTQRRNTESRRPSSSATDPIERPLGTTRSTACSL
jgi:hypothetical protein